jgi:hypothetical protein
MTSPLMAPTDLRDYATSQGWALLPEAVRDRLYVLTHPELPRRQLVFPMDTTAPDYAESVQAVTEKLAELERRSPAAVRATIADLRNDSLAVRIELPNKDRATLPLPFAVESVGAAEQLLTAAACTVLKPQAHHPRLQRAESDQLVQAAQFQHTEPGSFILRIACPLTLEVSQPQMMLLADPNIPFVRKTTVALHHALHALVSAVELGTLDKLVDEAKAVGARPVVSSNLCDALMRLHDPDLNNSLEVGVRWAPVLPVDKADPQMAPARIQQDYFPRIAEVARELRPEPKERTDTFIGTVESLNGDLGEDGRRAGEVVLFLLIENVTVRARATLSAEQYALADTAHMTDRAYVQVSGRLHPGKQPRALTDVRDFDILLPHTYAELVTPT